MNLLEGIRLKGKPAWIPDCSRNDLPRFFADLGFKKGAEIGVFQGEFTEKFCQAGLTMYAIDPWQGYSGAGRSEKLQTKQEVNFQTAKERLSPYQNCHLIRKTSMEALNDFKNESLDFIYIDGDHRFRYIAEDISEWFRKVKPGGIISGHDYICTHPGANNVLCHVQPVVDAFVRTLGIENFYTLGPDGTLSWMFFRQ